MINVESRNVARPIASCARSSTKQTRVIEMAVRQRKNHHETYDTCLFSGTRSKGPREACQWKSKMLRGSSARGPLSA